MDEMDQDKVIRALRQTVSVGKATLRDFFSTLSGRSNPPPYTCAWGNQFGPICIFTHYLHESFAIGF